MADTTRSRIRQAQLRRRFTLPTRDVLALLIRIHRQQSDPTQNPKRQ
jgi:hypothetical protein